MVALALFHAGGVVFFVLTQTHCLRRAGFASTEVGRARKGPRRGALLRDTHHSLHDDFDVVRREFQFLGRGVWRLGARTGAGVGGGQHQTRRVLDAQVGQRGRSLGQLQHGKAVIALANAQRDGLAGIPFLVFGLAVVAPLPFLAGQDTAHFSLHVDSGNLPKAKGLHKVVHSVYAQLIGQGIEVGVAGLHNRPAHVHDAATLVFRAAKSVAAEHIKAWIVNQRVGLTRAGFQRGQGHEWFVGRARRVGAAQCTVKQRPVGRLVEHLPVFLVYAFDKQIGVKRGLADKGQHVAVFRVQGHQRTTALAKHLLHQVLQLDVDGQNHRIARRGLAAGEPAHRPPARRGLDMLHAGDAMQLALKALLHAEFADVLGAAVVGLVVVVFDFFFFALVDTPDIANHMAGQFTIRVVAKQTRLDLHARKAKPLGGKACHFDVGEAVANGQRLKGFGLVEQLFKAAPVARRDLQHLR